MKTQELIDGLKQQAAKTTDPNTIGYLVTAAEAIARMHQANKKLSADREHLQHKLTKIRRLTMIQEQK